MVNISTDARKKYLERRMKDVDDLRESLKNNDFDFAIGVGHKIKGNGETFGHPEISKIGINIEDAAILKNKEELSLFVEKFALIVEEKLKQFN